MHTLSIRQPWVELILQGNKDVENRSWTTHHRGLILLHASKILDFNISEIEELKKYEKEFGFRSDSLPYGAIVGTIEIIEVTKEIISPWHGKGMYGWYLTNPKRFTNPIPFRGSAGIFDVPNKIIKNELLNV